MRPTEVLVCGHVTLDRHAGGLVPGGAVYYAGHAYRELGAGRVRVVTAAGPDHPGRAALEGLEVALEPAPRTTLFANHYGPDGRRTQRVEAAAPPLRPERLPARWRRPHLLHLAPVLGEVDVGAWCAAVQARFVGLGVQGWVRALGPEGRVEQPRWEWAPGALAGVAAACVGEDDLVGQGDLLERLAANVPVVAFTHGSAGCDVLVRGRSVVRVGVYPTREVDPTGAGDVFSAGFFLALARGASPPEAARLGAAAASIVVEAPAGGALARLREAPVRLPRVPVHGLR